MRTQLLSIVVGLRVIAAAAAGGQDTKPAAHPGSIVAAPLVGEIRVKDRPCETCLRLLPIAVLGDKEGLGELEDSRDVVRDSAGRYWIGQIGHVTVFDARGKVVRVLGEKGSGPMEFQWARPRFVDGAGRVHIEDTNLRMTVVSPEFTLAGAYQLPAQLGSAVMLPNGDVFVNAAGRTAGSLLDPLKIMREGKVLKSFGRTPLDSDHPLVVRMTQRSVAVSPGGTLFSAKNYWYEIGVWSAGAERLMTARRGPVLNERLPLDDPAFTDEFPIPNEIVAIQVPTDTTLLVLSNRRRPTWRSQMVQKTFRNGKRGLVTRPGVTADSIFFGRLEMIDTREWRVVARLDLPEVLVGVLDRRDLVAVRYDEDGRPQFLVLRASYVQ